MKSQFNYDYLFKVLLVGNSAVGKSSLILRFSDNIFNENFLPTIGVDFKIRTFELKKKSIKMLQAFLHQYFFEGKFGTLPVKKDSKQLPKIIFFNFLKITSSYYKGAQGVILVYDITDRKSFKELDQWMEEVNRHAAPNIIKLLIGIFKAIKMIYNQDEIQSLKRVNLMHNIIKCNLWKHQQKSQLMQTKFSNKLINNNSQQAFFALAESILENIVLFDDQTSNYQDKMQLQYGYSLEEEKEKKIKKSKCC